MNNYLKNEILSCYYIQEPSCRKSFDCSCVTKMTNRIERQIAWIITPREKRSLIPNKKLDIIFNWAEKDIIFDCACWLANQIIAIDIPNMNNICNKLQTTPEQVIIDHSSLLEKKIKIFLWTIQEWYERFLTPTVAIRNQDMNRLEISFKRWIKQEDKEKIITNFTKIS